MKRYNLLHLFLTAVCLASSPASGDTMTWVGATGNWFTAANWTNSAGVNGAPGTGDGAIIKPGASVLLTNATPELASLQMSGGTLVFSNWLTCLRATDVLIASGTVTIATNFTTAEPSNRVWIVCTNFTLGTNATINADQKGYAPQYGPGCTVGTASEGAGASHGEAGGVGRNYLPKPPYGNLALPLAPGSGGAITNFSGAGGGAVLIDASGTGTVFGLISANGRDGSSHGSGASGGSILLRCRTLNGSTNGLMRVNGGSGAGNGAPGRADASRCSTIPPNRP